MKKRFCLVLLLVALSLPSVSSLTAQQERPATRAIARI